MDYLLHSGLLLAGCFLYYRFLLRGETHFAFHRWLLLGCLVVSLTLPLVTVPASWSLREHLSTTSIPEAVPKAEGFQPEADVQGTEFMARTQGQTHPSPQRGSIQMPTARASAKIVATEDASIPIDWWKVAYWTYLAGVLVFGINFLIQFGQLLLRLIRYPGHDLGDYRLVELSEDAAPYSFWNRIFLNPDRYDPDTFHQIFQHEQIHVNQRHSLDLLLAELLVVFQWFNPFAWLYRRAIEDNLEFLTDAEMLRSGSDPEQYQLSLVRVAVPNFPNALVASYNQNFLEKRITMMKTKKSSLRSGWKYLTILPLLLVSVLQFNAVAQVVSPAPAPTPAPASAPNPVVNNVTVPAPVASPQRPLIVDRQIDLSDTKQFNSWTAIIEQPDICFQFMSRDRQNDNRHNFSHHRCFSVSAFSDLPVDEMGTFELKRAAGTITFKGVFEDDEGVGNFSFLADPAYESKLKSGGYGSYKEHELILLFLADVNDDYLSYLASSGLNPGHQELIELAIFYDDVEELKARIVTLEREGFGKQSLRRLIELQIHGVDAGYIEDLSKAGFSDLDLQDIVEAKIHGISSRFATEMKGLGFRELSFDRLKELAIHNISPEFVQELDSLGYKDLEAKEVLDAKIHGVNTNRIADWHRAGFEDLTLRQAKEWAIHGVDAEMIEGLRDLGFTELSVKDIVSAKIHGMTPRRLAAFRSTDLPMDDFDALRNAFVHGVDADFVRGFQAIGYDDIGLREATKMKIHGVSPEYAASFREFGYRDISTKTLQRLKIHGVTADYIRQWDRDDLDLDDYVKMMMQGISPKARRGNGSSDLGVARVEADVLYWSDENRYVTLTGDVTLKDNESNIVVTGRLSYGPGAVDAIIFNGRKLDLGEKINVEGERLTIELVRDRSLAQEFGLDTGTLIAVAKTR